MKKIKCILNKADDKSLNKKTDNLKYFLETMQPLESLSDVDVREYIDSLRGNSRIIGG